MKLIQPTQKTNVLTLKSSAEVNIVRSLKKLSEDSPYIEILCTYTFSVNWKEKVIAVTSGGGGWGGDPALRILPT